MAYNYLTIHNPAYQRTHEITEPQKRLISDIEKYLGIKFQGGDVRDASTFISQYKFRMEKVRDGKM